MSYKDNNKIVSYEKCENFFKKIRNNNKIVHCHGVFDLVHPGHLRHFEFCKTKGNLIVVSITPDKFIKKGLYRPLLPEKLRAKNLSALEIIDYVIIDQNKYPNNLIKKIKPNFFVKGYEYLSSNNPLTIKEKKIVERNGGQMIFSPGDIIFSSTKIINDTNPNFKYEKLKLYLDEIKINFRKIKEIINSFKNIKIHVLGDLIVDTNTECEVIGGLHKTPTLSLQIKNVESFVGGAGVVANHFRSISNNVTLTTLVGKDSLGRYAIKKLKKNKIKLNIITENGRPTTNKNSYYASKYKMLKVDKVSNEVISEKNISLISSFIKKTDCDILVFSDFRHGIFNKHTLSFFTKNIKKKTFKVADSQVASRWGNILDFSNFDLITPTEKEARLSLLEQDLPIRPLLDSIIKKSNCKNAILKLGEKGLIALSKNNSDYISLDPIVNNIKDTTGAGDALLAYASLALYKTKSLIIASIIGVIAASCKCETNGNKSVTYKQISQKIDDLERELNI